MRDARKWSRDGGTTPSPAAATRRTYTGQYDIGFWAGAIQHYNARQYDYVLGRFLQPDTIVPRLQGLGGLNRFAYLNNNPVNGVDPSGHGSRCGNPDGVGARPGCDGHGQPGKTRLTNRVFIPSVGITRPNRVYIPTVGVSSPAPTTTSGGQVPNLLEGYSPLGIQDFTTGPIGGALRGMAEHGSLGVRPPPAMATGMIDTLPVTSIPAGSPLWSQTAAWLEVSPQVLKNAGRAVIGLGAVIAIVPPLVVDYNNQASVGEYVADVLIYGRAFAAGVGVGMIVAGSLCVGTAGGGCIAGGLAGMVAGGLTETFVRNLLLQHRQAIVNGVDDLVDSNR